MTYIPRAYWIDRAARQGASYVGPGGDPARSDAEGRAFSKLIDQYMPQGKRVLDFGCGPGRLAPALLSLSEEYVGVDINPAGLAMAPRLDRASFLWLAFDSLPYPDASFDRICVAVVFQHIVTESVFLGWCAEIRRVLAPGGVVLVIDHRPLPHPAPHMRPRGPRPVAAALSLELARHEHLGEHWLGVFS